MPQLAVQEPHQTGLSSWAEQAQRSRAVQIIRQCHRYEAGAKKTLTTKPIHTAEVGLGPVITGQGQGHSRSPWPGMGTAVFELETHTPLV